MSDFLAHNHPIGLVKPSLNTVQDRGHISFEMINRLKNLLLCERGVKVVSHLPGAFLVVGGKTIFMYVELISNELFYVELHYGILDFLLFVSNNIIFFVHSCNSIVVPSLGGFLMEKLRIYVSFFEPMDYSPLGPPNFFMLEQGINFHLGLLKLILYLFWILLSCWYL